MAERNLIETTSVDATVMVVDRVDYRVDSAKMQRRAHLVAGYFGKYLTTTQFVESAGTYGACIKLMAFRERRRKVCFTPACRGRFGSEIRLLERLCIVHKHSVTIVTGDLATFQRKRDVQVVVLDLTDPGCNGYPGCTIFSTFIGKFLQRPSCAESALGF